MTLEELRNNINETIDNYVASRSNSSINAAFLLGDDSDNNDNNNIDLDVVTFKLAREIYRIVKYPSGPTATTWKALLEEDKTFNSADLRDNFVDAVKRLIQ